LDAMAALLCRLERKLYAEIAANTADVKMLKRRFIAEDGISARQFNALRIRVEGAIKGVQELLKTQIEETEVRIKAQDTKIKKLEKKDVAAKKTVKSVDAAKQTKGSINAFGVMDQAKIRLQLHQRKRRRAILIQCADVLRARLAAPTPGICFGSRKLFNAQFSLEANSYDNHAEWRSDWQNARADHIFCVGSKDETAGNQTCQGQVTADGSISLKLRLPDALAGEHGKHLRIPGLRFRYGHKQVQAALAACVRKEGQAVTWRFVRDVKGWRAFVSINESYAVTCGDTANGAIGVDVNADHLAIAVADGNGNPVSFRRISTPVLGASADQRKAIYGDAAKIIIDMARAHRVPIVLESLDFRKKKAELETSTTPRYARMLSALSYAQIGAMIRTRATRSGVRVIERNPAYTSLIGSTKFSARYGVSVHLSAALAIARRGMSLSERLPRQPSITLGGDVHVTLSQPARIGRRHVWVSWAQLARSRKAALAGRSRSAKRRSSAARSLDPAAERSLNQDGTFLSQLINSEPAGESPAAKSSSALLGRRTDLKATCA